VEEGNYFSFCYSYAKSFFFLNIMYNLVLVQTRLQGILGENTEQGYSLEQKVNIWASLSLG
jgi:hypothetical protein